MSRTIFQIAAGNPEYCFSFPHFAGLSGYAQLRPAEPHEKLGRHELMATSAQDHAKVVQLVGCIYDAALDSQRWTVFMEELAAYLNAGFGMLWLHDFSTGSACLKQGGENISAIIGLDSTAISQYESYYVQRNVWVPNARGLAEGSVVVSSALYPDRLLDRTEFYSGFLRPLDLYFAVGSSIVKQGTRDVKMSFVRSERAGEYDGAELDVLRQLLPHLRNAVALHRKLYRLKALSDSAMAALEMIPQGVILLTSAGLLLYANSRANELVARTGALGFGPTGNLHAASPTATASLQRLIQDAVRTGAGMGLEHGGTLGLVSANGRRLHVLVTPLPTRGSPFGGEAMAAIFCCDPDSVVGVHGVLSRRLAIIYRMTPAEALLTEALVQGQSLKQHAEARSITLGTARTQLKAAAAKTGAKRQADLVRMVLTGPAVFSPSIDPVASE